jgi:hypothetical protein
MLTIDDLLVDVHASVSSIASARFIASHSGESRSGHDPLSAAAYTMRRPR